MVWSNMFKKISLSFYISIVCISRNGILHLTSSKLEMSTSLTTFSSSLFVVNHLQNVVDPASSFKSTISLPISHKLAKHHNLSFQTSKPLHTHTHPPKNVFLPLVSSFAKQTLVISVTPSTQFSQDVLQGLLWNSNLSSQTPNFLLPMKATSSTLWMTLLLFTSFL